MDRRQRQSPRASNLLYGLASSSDVGKRTDICICMQNLLEMVAVSMLFTLFRHLPVSWPFMAPAAYSSVVNWQLRVSRLLTLLNLPPPYFFFDRQREGTISPN